MKTNSAINADENETADYIYQIAESKARQNRANDAHECIFNEDCSSGEENADNGGGSDHEGLLGQGHMMNCVEHKCVEAAVEAVLEQQTSSSSSDEDYNNPVGDTKDTSQVFFYHICNYKYMYVST